MRIAINGFGRIGRLTYRNLKAKGIEVVAINDLTDAKMLAHLLQYDTAHGRFDGEVDFDEKHIIVDGQQIPLFSEREAKNLPWADLKVDVVAECTGFYRSREKAMQHIESGAQKVVISAPAGADIKTIVMGVNDNEVTKDDVIISNASCTTNCLAPMAKILHENIGIESGFLNTVHAYTGDQRLHDAPHKKDMRRARAAAESIIPTSTGAAKAVGWVLPELKGKLDGMATRVPVLTGSLTDFTVVLKKETSREEINSLFKKAADSSMKGIVQYTEAALVSSDIKSSSYSCIFQGDLTKVQGNTAKLIAWYDNEMGYATRMVDLMLKF
ncbi:MAG: type I glyceraldehyde-3-phosphate dehydrogenase [Chitinophagales bacterium]